MNTQIVNEVARIPALAKIIGTYAHGLHHSITSAFNFSHPFFFTFGAHPGWQDMHVSLLTNSNSSRHLTQDQQHWSWWLWTCPIGQGSLHIDLGCSCRFCHRSVLLFNSNLCCIQFGEGNKCKIKHQLIEPNQIKPVNSHGYPHQYGYSK